MHLLLLLPFVDDAFVSELQQDDVISQELHLVEFAGQVVVERMNEAQLFIRLFSPLIQVGEEALLQRAQLFIIHRQNGLILKRRPVVFGRIADRSICGAFDTRQIDRLIALVITIIVLLVIVIIIIVIGDRGDVVIVI